MATASDAVPVSATAPGCPAAGLCGFTEGTRALIVDTRGVGAGHDLFTVTGIAGALAHDAPNPPFHRAYDAASSIVVPVVQRVYYFDRANRRLMLYDGYQSDMPLVDNVVDVRFAYFADASPSSVSRPADGTSSCVYDAGSPPVPRLEDLGGAGLHQLTAAQMTDGPVCGAGPNLFDGDLLRIRLVRVTLRLEAAADDVRGAGALVPAAGTIVERVQLCARLRGDVRCRAAQHDAGGLRASESGRGRETADVHSARFPAQRTRRRRRDRPAHGAPRRRHRGGARHAHDDRNADRRQLSPRAGGVLRRRGRARARAPRPRHDAGLVARLVGAASQRHIGLRRWRGRAARARWAHARPRAAHRRPPARERRARRSGRLRGRQPAVATLRARLGARAPRFTRGGAAGSTCRSTSWSGLQTTSRTATAIRRSTATGESSSARWPSAPVGRGVRSRPASRRTDDGDLRLLAWRDRTDRRRLRAP